MTNKIFYTQVWDKDKKYGKYANEFFSKLEDDEYGCLTDRDVLWLTNDYGELLYNYVEKYPEAVLTCLTNRIACPWQKLPGVQPNNHDTVYHSSLAETQKKRLYTITDVSKERYPWSAFCMLIKKSTWKEVGGFSEKGMLGIDNDFFFALQKLNKRILVMNGVYVYHQYRIDGSKKHLL